VVFGLLSFVWCSLQLWMCCIKEMAGAAMMTCHHLLVPIDVELLGMDGLTTPFIDRWVLIYQVPPAGGLMDEGIPPFDGVTMTQRCVLGIGHRAVNTPHAVVIRTGWVVEWCRMSPWSLLV